MSRSVAFLLRVKRKLQRRLLRGLAFMALKGQAAQPDSGLLHNWFKRSTLHGIQSPANFGRTLSSE
jgi:hypothetical protein